MFSNSFKTYSDFYYCFFPASVIISNIILLYNAFVQIHRKGVHSNENPLIFIETKEFTEVFNYF